MKGNVQNGGNHFAFVLSDAFSSLWTNIFSKIIKCLYEPINAITERDLEKRP